MNELFGRLVAQVKGATSLGLTDLNRMSESLFVPILSLIFGLKSLRNLNLNGKNNFPAIDLADDEVGISFQITASSDRGKIVHTLEEFIKHRLYTKYKRVVIYILTEKQRHYSDKGISEILKEQIDFNLDRDVIDYCDIMRLALDMPLPTQEKVLAILESQLTDSPGFLYSGDVSLDLKENLYLNLIPISFPVTLYIADLVGEATPFARGGFHPRRRMWRKTNERARVLSLLSAKGLKFSADWTCHGNQIITFHDLTDGDLPLTKIIDEGTITLMSPEEYYGLDQDQERVFKSLLHNCLKQKLYRRGVLWQEDDKMFIFGPGSLGDDKRVECWGVDRSVSRTVYERKPKRDDPTSSLYYKHLAFSRNFTRINSEWYVQIKPEWYFSRDGYKKSRFGHEKVEWLKRNERNQSVFNHFRFIAYFLSSGAQQEMFDDSSEPYLFMSFGQVCSLYGSPSIRDDVWRLSESTEEQKRMEDNQGVFDF
jgi:hypothetical protein